MKATVMIDGEALHVPDWVNDLESFRRWSDDDDFPENGRVSFLEGGVWIDMSKEQLYTHNGVKSEIHAVVYTIVKARRLGRYYSHRAYISNVDADVSSQPDGMFVSSDALREGRVRVIEGRAEGFVELEGSPDMVTEVVSRGSIRKDTVVLREAYAKAGIPEYWLVDARLDPLRFDILRLGKSGYTPARKRDGWARSEVFGQSFRLTRHEGDDGKPAFTLETRG